jgi:phosphoglycolate phosphatase
MNYALRRMKLPERSFDEIVSYIGTGVKDLISKSIGSAEEGLVERGVELYGAYYMAHPAGAAILYPHVKEVLEYFGKKKKYILTNRYARFADPVLKALGIRKYFADIIGGDDEHCLKPSACVLEPHISKLGIDKEKALIVGDMAIDIETGKNSGVKTCWVTYGLGKTEDVEPLKPDFVIDDIIELKTLIK